MKKSIRILAMVIVAAMLCTMLPVAIIAEEDGVMPNIYYTGADYTSDTVTIDGVIDAADGYVDLTPNGVPITLVNETLEGERWGGTVPTAFTLADAKAEHEAVGLTTETIVVKYYVAQDDENVYLAIEEKMPEVAYEVEGVAYNTNKYIMNNLRLGFNGSNPYQQIDLISDGFWAATGGTGTKWGVTYNGWIEHPFIVAGLADHEAFTSKQGPATDIVADYVDEANAPKDSRMELVKEGAGGMVTRTYELKLNKAAIVAEYAETFGVEDISFEGMYINLSATDYEWANNDDNYSLLFVTGTVNEGALLPDIVLFGNEGGEDEGGEEEPAAYPGEIFYTGAEYTSNTVTLDGAIDAADGYVCITPDGATNTFVDAVLNYGAAGNTPLNVVEPNTPAVEAGATDIVTKYYVAQDDDNVYVAVQQTIPSVEYTVDDVAYKVAGQTLIDLKLGFNPADPTQQINLYSDGFYITQSAEKTKWGVTYKKTWTIHPFMVTGFIAPEEYSPCEAAATGVIAEYVDAEGKALDSVAKYANADGTVTRTFEFKLNKAAIVEEYADVFNAEASFDVMWFALSQSDYKWANNKSNSSLFWVNGAVVDVEEYGVSILPNAVVFAASEDEGGEESQPEESQPEESQPEESQPEESQPAESQPAESQPAESQPAESQPEESQPEESQPEESQPEESQPEESQPEESQPEESQPEESQPAESQPAESQPAESQPAESQPAESQPAESQPVETEPATTEPATTEPETTKPAETKAPETTAKVEEKGGCGNSVGVAGLALVAALGTCTVFVAKKKED